MRGAARSLVVLLALAITFNAAQCFASCSRTVPPCHQHHERSDQKAQPSCSQHVTAAVVTHPEIPAPALSDFTAAFAIGLDAFNGDRIRKSYDPSPPDPIVLSTKILRI
jgi:hypothetical protein